MRVNISTVNKKTIESLIKSGAMDEFGNRASLLVSLPEIVNKVNQIKKQSAEGQASLFDTAETQNTSADISFSLPEIDDFTDDEKLNFEKEFLGFYLTSHPHLNTLMSIKPQLTHELDLLEELPEGERVKIGGIIELAKKIITKKSNSEMAFVNIADEKATTVECVVFPKVYTQYKNLLVQDTVIIVNGRLDIRDDKRTIIVESITSPTPAQVN